MNPEQQKILLKVAHDNIEAAIKKLPPPPTPQTNDPELNEPRGCFVTIKRQKQLRGCIGQFISDKPLIELVAEMALASSTKDPRFYVDPIKPQELLFLTIEISVLSKLKKTDNPLSLRLGIDGIYITDGTRSGCFLPQVAVEAGWTEEQFLIYCCVQKAHLDPDAWQDKGVDVYLFTADVFEKSFDDI